MNLFKKIRFKTLVFFLILYGFVFYILNLIYVRIVFVFFDDIVKVKSHPNDYNLHSSINQHRLVYFNLLMFYKNLVIFIILIPVVFIFLKIYNNAPNRTRNAREE
jgi:hypothetical protein